MLLIIGFLFYFDMAYPPVEPTPDLWMPPPGNFDAQVWQAAAGLACQGENSVRLDMVDGMIDHLSYPGIASRAHILDELGPPDDIRNEGDMLVYCLGSARGEIITYIFEYGPEGRLFASYMDLL